MRSMLLMVSVLAIGGCSMGQDMGATDAAIADFHAKFSAGQSAAITAAAGPEIRNGQTDFTAMLDALHTKLGAFKSSSRQGFNDNYNNGEHQFSASYASTYANGPATENFVYRLNGGKPVLIGYHVESAALLRPDPAPAPQAPGAVQHTS